MFSPARLHLRLPLPPPTPPSPLFSGDADVRSIHYHGSKPWDLARSTFDDMAPWFEAAGALERACPLLRGHLHVQGAIEGGASR